jgi:hypothetical protein
MSDDQLAAKLYRACLDAIRGMGVAEFKKATWFGWKSAKMSASVADIKKAA